MPGQPRKKRTRDEFEITNNRKISKFGQVKKCSHCCNTGHNISKCPELGRGPQAADHVPMLSKTNVRDVGLYIDPISGQKIMHPGTPSEHIIDAGHNGRASTSAGPSRSIQPLSCLIPQAATSPRNSMEFTRAPVPTKNKSSNISRPTPKAKHVQKSNAKTQSGPIAALVPKAGKAKEKSHHIASSGPRAASGQSSSSGPPPALETRNFTPPPLPQGHSSFKRSRVLCIPRRKDWVTTSQLHAHMLGKKNTSKDK